jgi:hypothetical protein
MENEEKIVSQVKDVCGILIKLRDDNPVLQGNQDLYFAIGKLQLLKNVNGEYILGKYDK